MQDWAKNQAVATQMQAAGMGQMLGAYVTNPTLEANIDAKIQSCRDEIERLLKVKQQIPPSMLAMNLRDLQEAMRF